MEDEAEEERCMWFKGALEEEAVVLLLLRIRRRMSWWNKHGSRVSRRPLQARIGRVHKASHVVVAVVQAGR